MERSRNFNTACNFGTDQIFTLLLLLLSRFSRVRLCATPWTAAYQASQSMGFSRQEHWSGLPFPSPIHENGKWKWSCSVMSDCLWPHGLQHTKLSFTIFSSLLKLTSVKLVMPSNHHSFISMNIQSWYPLGLTSLILLSKGLSNLKPSVSQFKSISSLVLNLLYDTALTCNWTGRWC